MEYIDYLSLDSSDDSNITPIFAYAKSKFDEWRNSRFSPDFAPTLEGVLLKFIDMARYYDIGAKEKLLADILTIFKPIMSSTKKKTIKTPVHIYKSIYLQLSSLLSKIFIEIQHSLASNHKSTYFSRLYVPQLSNKQRAIELVEQAIEVLRNDSQLPNRLKEELISQLNFCLELLRNDNTNWKSYWGTIKQTILILGAIGSIASGVQGVQSIVEAKSKLEQASQAIETTSINYNFQFNSFNKQIGASKTTQHLLVKK